MLAVWSAAMAATMLPSELPLLRLDHATPHSAVRTVVLPVTWVLAAAAVYQLTPLKRRCLAVCRSPLARVPHGWRDGLGGAFRMGVGNGLRCLGCCVGLTAALVALGMTNIWWMLAVGAAILVEKTTRVGVTASRAAALALAIGALTL
jgi:predicted metal-binding membrane protein